MPIQIVEPTLVSDAGHCAAIFNSLFRAAPDLPYQLWADRRVRAPSVEATGIAIKQHFFRPLRRLQALRLYRRLLRGPDPLYIPTASYADLKAIVWLARTPLPADKVFLYFHKWRTTPQRQRAVVRIAQQQPNLHVLGASIAIANHLRTCGFAHVDTLVPITAEANLATPMSIFRHLLFAGAARRDKGFTQIVNLIAQLNTQPEVWPIVVQTTGDHYGRYDSQTRADLDQLRSLNYKGLRTIDATPDRTEYAQLFPGAICLQPYDRHEYAEKASAITFDALMAGAPIVTLSGTPMAQWVENFGAGVVVEDAAPQTLLTAVTRIRNNYGDYAARARDASSALDPKRAWAPLIEGFRRSLQRTHGPNNGVSLIRTRV